MKRQNIIRLGILSLLAVMVILASPVKGFNVDSLKDENTSRTVLFITGAFVTNSGWEEWRKYFEEHGYTTYAPPWPFKDATAADLRARHPDGQLASLTFEQLVDSYAAFAENLQEKPILIGHSTGGLIAQLLLQRGLGVACVAYHSVPPKGVLTLKWSFVKSVTPAFGLFKSKKKTYLMSLKHWQYAFTNGMPLDEQKKSYDQNTTPESRRVARGAIGKHAKIYLKKPHLPLLFVSGDQDHIMPASLNQKNYRKYKDENSIIEYKEFPGRNHFAMAQPGWREDADYILSWIGKVEREQIAASSK
jgi:pimeloyl-ACP methyl ester carboxylesterase